MEVTELDTVELVESMPLAGLERVHEEDVYRHVDYLVRELPGPVDLYARWERQQWSATALDFSRDLGQWAQLPAPLQEGLRRNFRSFFYGERAVTDTLAPLLLAAPTHDDRLFLSTQMADEARHAHFFRRFFEAVDGAGGAAPPELSTMIEGRTSSGFARIFDPSDGALARSTDEVRRDPADHGAWVRAVVVYHLFVEGVVALTGQRYLLRTLRRNELFPTFRAGFTAVTRDESRHVSYGVWAVREAVRAGHETDVLAAVDLMLEPSIRIYANPDFLQPSPHQIPPTARSDPREAWRFAVEAVTKRLRTAGVASDRVAAIERRAWTLVEEAVPLYEELHGVEHPVRAWERGEVEA